MLNRRRFIAIVPVAAVGLMGSLPAQAVKLTEADPAASALHYKEDASKVDAKANPMWKAGNICGNCQQYSGKAGAASGPCSAFGGKEVAAKGWCMAWVKKA